MTAGPGPDADVLGLLVLAFDGTALPVNMEQRLASAPAAGVTLFCATNVGSPAQVRALTDATQRAATASGLADGMPLLVAIDQEGGQLQALGGASTPFAGNMALGAVGDALLAERVGHATGRELLAVGVNVAYAPVCDLATNPANPAIGIRSFGEEPFAAAGLVAAMVRGMRAAGVAATAKHFPGLGDVALDTHDSLALTNRDRRRLESTELVPFRAAVEAGVDLVMSAHLAVPALTGDRLLPATLSREVMHDLLRTGMGFTGLSVTDALDMGALAQGRSQILDAIAALQAGVDLLLCTPDQEAIDRIEEGLQHAMRRRLLESGAVRASLGRVSALRRRLGSTLQPDLHVVGCADHALLARELAERSITVVRNDDGLLPLKLETGARVAAMMPTPRDLTPADTSSTVVPTLADALRRHHGSVEEFVTGHPPSDAEIAALRDRAAGFDLLVIGTISATIEPAQAALVNALLDTGVPAVTVALRTPFDLGAYPRATTHVCTYGILRPSLDALADVLWGAIPPVGRLPASIAGLAPVGSGLTELAN
ncbi:MAG: glycoside hydrolase family 3 N-terminal domain-containing protein [Candidatus Limnocylindrales bacterium]